MLITKNQIIRIHAQISSLGLSDDEYRAILSAWNVKTSKDLTYTEANDLIAILLTKGHTLKKDAAAEAKRRADPQADRLRDFRASPRQVGKIKAMWREVSRQTTDEARAIALNNFIEKRFKISRVEWLPGYMVGRVIRVLEIMIKQKHEEVQSDRIDNGTIVQENKTRFPSEGSRHENSNHGDPGGKETGHLLGQSQPPESGKVTQGFERNNGKETLPCIPSVNWNNIRRSLPIPDSSWWIVSRN
jgi:hypothetical protein